MSVHAANRPTFSEHWHRVASLRPSLAPGVRTARQRFRGGVWHTLESPLGGETRTASSHSGFARVSGAAWRFIALLDGKRTVENAWKLCVDSMEDDAPTQPEAVNLLGQLHASGLLSADLPPDAELIFRGSRRRARSETTSAWTNWLSVRVPLVDPDRFISVLAGATGWIFSPAGVLAWAVLLAVGAAQVLSRWDRFVASGTDVLAPANIPWLYLVFAAIKLCHELGHGVACKEMARREGGTPGSGAGRVGAMGVLLLLLVPVPFVDASSAWALKSKWRRMVVGGAGMYVELAIAAVAAVVWARSTEGSLVSVLAHNAVLIASVSTLMFNANPLLKYDGYYMLADLVEIPNLARRARDHVFHLVRLHIWGDLRAVTPVEEGVEGAWLAVYFVASSIFRVVIFAGIALWLVGQWFIVGVLAGAFLLVGGVAMPLARLARFLAADPSLIRCRPRAILTTLIGAAVLFCGVCLIPLPQHVRLDGIVEPASTSALFAREGGTITDCLPDGTTVQAGDVLVRQSSPELIAERRSMLARLEGARAAQRRAMMEDAAKARIESDRVNLYARALASIDERTERLTTRAPIGGVWISPRAASLVGVFAGPGQPLGEVSDTSQVRVRCVAGQRQAGMLAEQGAALRDRPTLLRSPARPGETISAMCETPRPAGTSHLPSAALGEFAGGSIHTAAPTEATLPTTAAEPFFEVIVSPRTGTTAVDLRPGSRVEARVSLPPSPLLTQIARTIRQTFQERAAQGRAGR